MDCNHAKAAVLSGLCGITELFNGLKYDVFRHRRNVHSKCICHCKSPVDLISEAQFAMI